MIKRLTLSLVLALAGSAAQALGLAPFVQFQPAKDAVSLTGGIAVDAADEPAVRRAVGDLAADLERVTRKRPAVQQAAAPKGTDLILVGTLGKSALIDALVAAGKLDVSPLKGQWEGWQIAAVAQPLPGVERALVIVGSDRRGTVYGIYELSEQIGVSPWTWWADVPVTQRTALYVPAGTRVQDAPVVRYRGIFLNDEAPALTGWSKEKFGGYNSKFYAHVFELILRLRGNFIWPAMWGSAFFADDAKNGPLAEEYGVVIGTSHHEPLMRAHREWADAGGGPWDYNRNAERLRGFWQGGLAQSRGTERAFTLGMRGDGDEPMSRDANVALLERIVADQRQLIDKEPDAKSAMQVWALYKEVQDYYEKGMRVPDDVTLLWADDNWGNIRRLPTKDERARSGGAGVYYHFDYVGGPRNYKWINVTPVAKVWEQMHLAWQYGATKQWVVNVGDLKPMEVPIDFFLNYAWNPARWPTPDGYLRAWAAREFGAAQAVEIADLVQRTTQANHRRKPELLAPETYSLVNEREAERVVADYRQLATRAKQVRAKLPAAAQDAFFQLIEHPIEAGRIVTELHVTAAQNRLYARQGRTSTNAMAAKARDLFAEDAALTRRYHSFNNGKWNQLMAQTHLGYFFWNEPPLNIMPAVSEVQPRTGADVSVAVEGSEQVADTIPAVFLDRSTSQRKLPALDVNGQRSSFIEVFNRGDRPFTYTARTEQPWLKLHVVDGKAGEPVLLQQRVAVSVDWDAAPTGDSTGYMIVETGGDRAWRLAVPVRKPAAPLPEGFVESRGVVAIEAASHAREVAPPGRQWLRLPGHSRTGDGMTPLPVDVPAPADPKAATMRLEYPVNLSSSGKLTVHTTVAPTLKFQPDWPANGLRFAVSIDDGPLQIVNMHAASGVGDGNREWERNVSNSSSTFQTRHEVSSPGPHVLKFWVLEPGVVLHKMVIDAGGLKPSYLGPQESAYVKGPAAR